MKGKDENKRAIEKHHRLENDKSSQGRTKHGAGMAVELWGDKMSGKVSAVNIACLLGANSYYTRYRVLLEGVTTTMLTLYTVKYVSRELLQVDLSPI